MNRLKKTLKQFISNTSVAFLWELAFFAVVIICIVGLFVGYEYVRRSTDEIIEKYNCELMLERVDMVDNNIAGLMSYIDTITRNGDLSKIQFYDTEISKEEKYFLFELCRRLGSVTLAGSEETQKILYLPETQCIIYSGTIYSAREFFNIEYGSGDFESWNNNILKSEEMISYDEEHDTLCFRKKSQRGNVDVMLLVPNYDFIKADNGIAESDFIICDINKKQIVSKSGRDYSELLESLDFSLIAKNEKIGDNMITYQSVLGYDWSYVSVFDTKDAAGAIARARIIMIICVVISLISAMAVGSIFIKRNNRSIYELMNRIKVDNDGSRNEYVYISNAMNKIISQNKEKEHMFYMANKKLKNNNLRDVLTGETNPSRIKAVLNEYELLKKSRLAMLIEAEIYDCDSMFYEGSFEGEENLSLAKFIVANVYGDLYGSDILMYTTENGSGKILMVFPVDNDKKCDKIREIAKYGTEFIKEQLNIGFKLYISDVHSTETELSKCYSDITKIKEYRTTEEKPVLDIKELKETKVRFGYYHYPEELEKRFIKALKTGDYTAASETIDEMFVMNRETCSSLRMLKVLAANIENTIIRNITIPSKKIDAFFTEIDEFNDMLSKSANIMQIKDALLKPVKYVCMNVEKREERNEYSLINEVKSYVDRNYSDVCLDVNSIALEFDVNISRLSSLFKKQEGMGLLEYITRIRVEAVKKYIMNTDENIKDIAEKNGFGNERTFYRVFEKYTGEKPGNFRKR